MEVARSNPVTVPCFCLFFDLIFLLINLFIDIIHDYFQIILIAEYRFNVELMHSAASRICDFVFHNIQFSGHFV